MGTSPGANSLSIDPYTRDLLQLTLIPGLGPVRVARLLEAFQTPDRALGASPAQLERVKGIGGKLSSSIAAGRQQALRLMEAELAIADKHQARVIAKGTADYPAVLAPLADAPPILYVRGDWDPAKLDPYCVAIVGSRRCTAYGYEQAGRFATALASAGLTIVSGGARGIDTAAHRGAMNAQGRTFVVQGCGLAHVYPSENEPLFADIVRGRGAIVSELPMTAPPERENFPARNRIISGMSLGVIVIEAQEGSGALITAKVAAEDHGREVMAVPGRVDSDASRGTHELIKQGGAALITEPADVLQLLETPARHTFQGTHASRYADPGRATGDAAKADSGLWSGATDAATTTSDGLLAYLDEPLTLEELCGCSGLPVAKIQAELTLLEMQGRVRRIGSKVGRAHLL